MPACCSRRSRDPTHDDPVRSSWRPGCQPARVSVGSPPAAAPAAAIGRRLRSLPRSAPAAARARSEEHTSELQSHSDLVCRLLLEKKKIKKHKDTLQTIDSEYEQ